MSELEKSIERIEAFIRLKRQSMSPVMVADIEATIAAAKRTIPDTTGMLRIKPWCIETWQNACSCDENDGSYVCKFCRSQGIRGYIERSA